MSNQMKKIVPTYDTKIALAVANNVYVKHGYVRTTEATFGERQSNKQRVTEALAKANPKYTKKDMAMAEEIIDPIIGSISSGLPAFKSCVVEGL